MSKKEFTKKQLRKGLTTLTESKADIKSELKKAYKALKSLKSLLVGHKSGDQTLSFSDLKKIKTAARHIEDIYEDMTDEEMTDKEEKKTKEVEKKNEQSEGHGKMYNALQGVREGKVIKINEATLRKVVERVIKEQEQEWPDTTSAISIADQFKNIMKNMDRELPIAYQNEVSLEDLTEAQLAELYSYIEWIKSVLEAKANQGNP